MGVKKTKGSKSNNSNQQNKLLFSGDTRNNIIKTMMEKKTKGCNSSNQQEQVALSGDTVPL